MRIQRFLLLLILASSCEESAETTEVLESELTLAVYATAFVKAEAQHQLFSTAGGPITDIPVEAGDTVLADEVIMLIRNTNPALNEENARLAVELARANYSGNSSAVKTLELQRQLAYQQMQEDSLNFERQKKLWAEKIGSKSELEKRELAYLASKSNYELLGKQISQAKDQTRTSLLQAENNLKISRQNSADFEVRADMNGIVYAVLKEKGETVRAQEAVAVIGSADEFYLELQVDEEDISDLNPGQKVIIRLDAFGDQVLEGRLRRIEPLMDRQSQAFTAEADIHSHGFRLFPGISGEANIILEQREKTLHIPISYLVNDSTVLGKGQKPLHIATGMRSMDRIEVLEGLAKGQLIYKPLSE